jgi:hypothetical protein
MRETEKREYRSSRSEQAQQEHSEITPAPGKRTLTEETLGDHAAGGKQIHASRSVVPAVPWQGRSSAPLRHAARPAPGSVLPRLELATAKAPADTTSPDQVQAAARHGISGTPGALPFQDTIQRAFGRHDISHIKAYTDGAAEQGAKQMGARAFAMGNHVAFAESPSLHTAAHEAAHVIQQRAGVQLAGGVGAAGDSFEQHADEVADRVVRGESAEDLLGPVSDTQSAQSTIVQRLLYDVRIENNTPLSEEDARSLIDEACFFSGIPEDKSSVIADEVICRYLTSDEKIVLSDAVDRVYDELFPATGNAPVENSPSSSQMGTTSSVATTSAASVLTPSHEGTPYGPECRAFLWTNGGWQPLYRGYDGRLPSHRGEKEGEVYDANKELWYQSERDYRHHTQRLRNPAFVPPPSSSELHTPTGSVSRHALETLNDFLRRGVRTPEELEGRATSSADTRRRTGREISVNVLRSDEDPAKVARYATMNPANGAIPVVLEQHGDEPSSRADESLAGRARESALAVIRPDDLSDVQQDAIRRTDGTGEATLEGAIPASNFVRVLVPGEFKCFFSEEDVARYKIQFVGTKKTEVPYNPGGTRVTIDVPAFEEALSAILRSNPTSIFLTHAIRLGAANPIRAADAAEGRSSEHQSAEDEQAHDHHVAHDNNDDNHKHEDDDEFDLC